MNREDFRTLAYGQYLRSHREDKTIDIKEADNYVAGAMFAYDKLRLFKLEPISFPIGFESNCKKSVLSSSTGSV